MEDNKKQNTTRLGIIGVIGLAVVWIFAFYGGHALVWASIAYLALSPLSFQVAISASVVGCAIGIYHARTKVNRLKY